MKIIELFESKDKNLKTLYCSRKLLNGDDIVKWAKEQGFKKVLEPSDMHATIAYSKDEIDWTEMTDSFDTVVSRKDGKKDKTKRAIKAFGEKGDAIVLTFESDDLKTRWKEFIDDFGASWDHDGYHPHVTITYDGLPKGMKLEDIAPYEGELRFGPEIMEPVNTKWKSSVKEKKVNESALYYVQPDGKWKQDADGRSKGRTKAEVEEMGGEITESRSTFLDATPENVERARDFVLKKWKERAVELGRPEPSDLSSSCKFSSLFVQQIFGGKIMGNSDHQFVKLNGKIIDLNIGAEDVREYGASAHHHDPIFWHKNPEHKESMRSCESRVDDWAKEFRSMTTVDEDFHIRDVDDIDQFYNVFKTSYEDQTGAAWSEDKLLSRARNWTFYGDEQGFVAVRVQGSGMKKLVAVAGDPRSIVKGLNELQASGGPIWGAVSAPLATMAKKRGMVVPHLIPGGAFFIKVLAKTIPPAVFGGHEPQVTKDGGLVFSYEDVGETTKYIVGNKEYFKTMLSLPHVMQQLQRVPGLERFLKMLGMG